MYQVTMDEARATLPQLVQAARNGEEVIITENSFAVAKLITTGAMSELSDVLPPRQPGSARGLIHMRDDFDDAKVNSHQDQPEKPRRKPGSALGKGYEFSMAEDFDTPLEDFAEYM